MIDIRAAVPPDAPEEVKQFVKGLKNLTLPAPETTVLAEIVAAGTGEHQDRLFTQAVKKQMGKAINAFMDQMEAVHAASCKKCGNGTTN
jgi:hypothetical protein